MPPPLEMPTSDLVLLAHARQGCQESARILVRKWEEAVLPIIRRKFNLRLRSRLDPCDALQSVLVVVFSGDIPVETFNSDEALLRYVIGMIANKLQTYNSWHLDADKRTLRQEVPMPADVAARQPSPDRIVAAREEWQRLLDTCPGHLREALRLLAEGHTQEEAVRQTGVPERTLRRWLEQTRRKQPRSEQVAPC